MSSPLPLSDAAQRLRRRPGRPRKVGYVAGTLPAQGADTSMVLGGTQDRPSNVPSRLMTLQQAAVYLSVSTWTVRELEALGKLHRVKFGIRRVLYDRLALDKLIALHSA